MIFLHGLHGPLLFFAAIPAVVYPSLPPTRINDQKMERWQSVVLLGFVVLYFSMWSMQPLLVSVLHARLSLISSLLGASAQLLQ